MLDTPLLSSYLIRHRAAKSLFPKRDQFSNSLLTDIYTDLKSTDFGPLMSELRQRNAGVGLPFRWSSQQGSKLNFLAIESGLLLTISYELELASAFHSIGFFRYREEHAFSSKDLIESRITPCEILNAVKQVRVSTSYMHDWRDGIAIKRSGDGGLEMQTIDLKEI